MNMNRYIVGASFVLFVALLLGCTKNIDSGINADKESMEKQSMEHDSMGMAKEEHEMMDDKMMKDKSSMGKESGMGESGFKGEVLAGSSSKYLEFSKADYERALNEKEIIVLYFYANWCPLCKKEQPEIFGAFDQLGNPAVIGFRVNYKDSDTDTDEEAMAEKFGVAYQHTKVILKNGQKVLKAPDSWDKQRYLTELAKV